MLSSPLLTSFLIHTAVSFASFLLTTSVERRLNTALLGADPTEMMQDYSLHVLELTPQTGKPLPLNAHQLKAGGFKSFRRTSLPTERENG
jgi:hypothetical protein